jgi:hypothetical protein
MWATSSRFFVLGGLKRRAQAPGLEIVARRIAYRREELAAMWSEAFADLVGCQRDLGNSGQPRE